MAAKIELKPTIVEKADWETIGIAEESVMERFQSDLRDMERELALFESRVENLMTHPYPRRYTPMKGVLTPLDIEQTKDAYMVRMNLPGIPKDLVLIKFLDQTLEIDVEQKMGKEIEKRNYVVRERKEFEFHRRLEFPTPIAPEKAEAKLEHGILTVTVPTLKPAKEVKVPLT